MSALRDSATQFSPSGQWSFLDAYLAWTVWFSALGYRRPGARGDACRLAWPQTELEMAHGCPVFIAAA